MKSTAARKDGRSSPTVALTAEAVGAGTQAPPVDTKSQTKATKAKPAPGHAAKTSPSPERVASSASRRAGSPVPNNPHGLPDKREELRTSKRGAPIKEKPKSPRAAYQRELMAKRRAAKKDKP